MVFTDIVGSTALKQSLGDREAAELIQRHHSAIRETLAEFPDGEEIGTAGDSFLLVFERPSDAVRFALSARRRLRALNHARGTAVLDRFGLHLGEVVVHKETEGVKPKDLYSIHVDTCARVMSLATGDRVLLTRVVFDNARQQLGASGVEGVGQLAWFNHGPYELAGLDEPIEICEVAELSDGPRSPPADNDKARHYDPSGKDTVIGWRPATGEQVPDTRYVLDQKLGEGAVGEAWLGHHTMLQERRVFKFCFRPEQIRSLKREVTLFRLLRERVGAHPNIVGVQEVSLDKPPYYLVLDYAEGRDLATWFAERRGTASLEEKLELVAQVAEALQAAHEAGVIHCDVKPSNVLVEQSNGRLRARLTDFGIGQVISAELLDRGAKHGFTQEYLDRDITASGTQLYMAPELLAGARSSPRSDIYSLGVVLYQLLVGELRRPVTTDWAEHVQDPLLRDDLAHCFSGDPAKRFVGAGQLAQNLRTLGERRAALARRQAEEDERQKEAYRRGVVRAAGYAGVIIVVAAWLAIQARGSAEEAQRLAAESRGRLLEQYVSTGTGRLDDGDSVGAMPYFAQALSLVQGTGGDEPVARARLRAALDGSPRLVAVLEAPLDLRALAFSPDGEELAAASRHQGLLRWRWAEPGAAPRVERPLPELSSVAWSGDLLAVASPRELVVLDARTLLPSSPVIALDPRRTSAGPIELSEADGIVSVLSSCGDVPVERFELTTGRRIPTPSIGGRRGRGEPEEYLCFSSGSRAVIAQPAAFGELRARLVALPAFTQLGEELTVLSPFVLGTFDPGGHRLAVHRSQNELTVLDASTGDHARSVRHPSTKERPRFSPDGRLLATASSDGSTRVFDASSAIPVAPPVWAGADVAQAVFHPDSRRFATASGDGLVRVYQLRGLSPEGVEVVMPFSSRDQTRVLAYAEGRQARLYDGDGRPISPAFSNVIAALGWSADDCCFALATREGLVVVARDGQPAPGGPIPFRALSYASPWRPERGHELVAAGEQGAVVYDGATGVALSPVLAPGERLRALAWAEDGAFVVTSAGGRARRWDPTTGAPRGEAVAVGDHPVLLALSGGRLATGTCHDDEHRACIYDGETGARVGEPLDLDRVARLASDTKDGRVVGTSDSGEVRIFDARSGRPLTRAFLETNAGFTGFTADGAYVVTVALDVPRRRSIWDARTGERVAIAPLDAWPGFSASPRAVVELERGLTDARPVEDWIAISELLAMRRVGGEGVTVPAAADTVRSFRALAERYPTELGGP